VHDAKASSRAHRLAALDIAASTSGQAVLISGITVLIAMAGMRMHAPGHVEISAVCTDVAARGRGLASTLVRDLVARIRDRGETPMLHVAEDNIGAIPIYESLGFETRLRTEIFGARAPL